MAAKAASKPSGAKSDMDNHEASDPLCMQITLVDGIQ